MTNTPRRLYGQEMDKATTRQELDRIMLDACMDLTNQQPRHNMATLASIYRTNTERLILEDIPY